MACLAGASCAVIRTGRIIRSRISIDVARIPSVWVTIGPIARPAIWTVAAVYVKAVRRTATIPVRIACIATVIWIAGISAIIRGAIPKAKCKPRISKPDGVGDSGCTRAAIVVRRVDLISLKC